MTETPVLTIRALRVSELLTRHLSLTSKTVSREYTRNRSLRNRNKIQVLQLIVDFFGSVVILTFSSTAQPYRRYHPKTQSPENRAIPSGTI